MDAREYKQSLLDALYEPYKKCLECPLGFLGRKNVVFGEGNPDAKLMFIGEAPGRDEDEQGRPFVGRSGQLLNRALKLCAIDRSEVYISNIVKCRPPDNRLPLPVETNTCKKLLLFNQIKIIRPTIICTLGSVALNSLFDTTMQITKVRGTLIEKDGLTVIPVFHPAYILRNQKQADIWLQDLQMVKKLISEVNPT